MDRLAAYRLCRIDETELPSMAPKVEVEEMPTLEVLAWEEMCLEVTEVAPMPLKVAGEVTGTGVTAVAPVALAILVEGEDTGHTALPAASLRLPMLLRVLETSLRIHPP